MSPVEISERIKRIMKVKRLSVKELAQRADLKPVTIYQWRRADSKPGSNSLPKLASGLEVTTDFLLGLTSYDGVPDRAIAVRESQAIYLRSQDIGPNHPDYKLYERLVSLKSAPINVDGWKQLSTEMLPIIREHDTQENELKRALEKSGRKKNQRKTRGIVLAMQPRSQHSKKGTSREK